MTQIKLSQLRSQSTTKKDFGAKAAYDEIQRLKEDLRQLCTSIHDEPELGYEEFKTCAKLTSFVSAQDLKVKQHAYDIPTSFEVEYGTGGRVVTFCAEYDALPGIGHACGHNLIATSSTAAFLGVVASLKQSKVPGRVRLLGTPAEEAGGGKIKLIEAGAFEDVDAALMIHAGPRPVEEIDGDSNPVTLAIIHFSGTFSGKNSHAGFAPWLGINALDAASLTYTAVGMLRQQVRPQDRINIIISGNENLRTNIIPDTSKIQCGVRSDNLKNANILKERIVNCLQGAALATGCTLELSESPYDAYAELRPNETLSEEFSKAMTDLGSRFTYSPTRPSPGGASTDMGNVSYVCPTFHGGFCIRSGDAVPHTIGFAKATGTSEAFEAAIKSSKGMASTALRFLADDAMAYQVKLDFEADKKNREV